ncbi:MAG: ABC transporter ATP-binding protein [Beduini sp.]|uniref:ABC transporter ATP-binding protein n=1 Tax=Beduini sp. TaxID=1922300 RepID=UPI0039A3C24F
MNEITMKHVSKSFMQKKVLDDIDLEIHKGEIFGLLGPSGAGKTTMVKLLSGQMSYCGNILIHNLECREHHLKWIKTMGMSMDEYGFYRRLSVWTNLCMFAKVRGISKQRVIEVLQQLSLYEDRKTTIQNLSKGMKQRLSFANAILHKPSLVFLDEPTSGLDPNTMKELHDIIRQLNHQGTTVFLTTHNMEEASKLCDHVALLNEGHIVLYGQPKELCQRFDHLSTLLIHTRDQQMIKLKNTPENADQLAYYLRTDNIESIHSSEPNLEQIFREVTGRRLL